MDSTKNKVFSWYCSSCWRRGGPTERHEARREAKHHLDQCAGHKTHVVSAKEESLTSSAGSGACSALGGHYGAEETVDTYEPKSVADHKDAKIFEHGGQADSPGGNGTGDVPFQDGDGEPVRST